MRFDPVRIMADRPFGLRLGMVETFSLRRDARASTERKTMPTPGKTKANFGTAWMSDNDFRTVLAKINATRNQQDILIRRNRSDVERQRMTLESSLSNIPERDRASMVNKAVAGHRAELARKTSDSRLALVRELSQLADRVRSASSHYRSPMQMLMRDTLGSERRSRIQMQIEQSGPVELASLAELAAATKDKELAAALCGRVHGIKRDDRPFDAADLADVLCGELHRELNQAMVEAERRVLEALQADTEFETGKPNPQRALQIAMLKKREEEIAAYQRDEHDQGSDDPASAPTETLSQ